MPSVCLSKMVGSVLNKWEPADRTKNTNSQASTGIRNYIIHRRTEVEYEIMRDNVCNAHEAFILYYLLNRSLSNLRISHGDSSYPAQLLRGFISESFQLFHLMKRVDQLILSLFPILKIALLKGKSFDRVSKPRANAPLLLAFNTK